MKCNLSRIVLIPSYSVFSNTSSFDISKTLQSLHGSVYPKSVSGEVSSAWAEKKNSAFGSSEVHLLMGVFVIKLCDISAKLIAIQQ